MSVMPPAREALDMLAFVPPDECGALIRQRADGSMAGAILVERGRVCWAMSESYATRLTDLLIAESPALTHEVANALFAQCRRDHIPLGETLVERGLVSQPVLHRVLLRHTCEALVSLLRADGELWAWLEHAGYGYNPMLTFSPSEIITAVHALSFPTPAANALAALARAIGPGQRGFAIQRSRGDTIPVAQIGCEDLDVVALGDLARQASEVMAVGQTVDVELAVCELDGRGMACWVQDNVLFVLLCDGELAFNRLLAQTAAMVKNPEGDVWQPQKKL